MKTVNTTQAVETNDELDITKTLVNGYRTVIETVSEVECFVTKAAMATPKIYGRSRKAYAEELDKLFA